MSRHPVAVDAIAWAYAVDGHPDASAEDRSIALSILNNDSGRWFGRTIDRPLPPPRVAAPAPMPRVEPSPEPRRPVMGTAFPEIFAALAAPFSEQEVKVRAQGGRTLHYITARTAMNRLDSVLGPENWWDDYEAGEAHVMCRLTIRLPDGATVTKADAGGYAGMEVRGRNGEMIRDDENNEKSGFSDAFKRACAKFGVARYLYRDGVPDYCGEAQEPRHDRAASPPPMPRREAPPEHRPEDASQERRDYGTPRTGRALFAWTKEMEQKHEVGLLKYLNNWSKLQEFPARMVDWDAEQVALAHAEAVRKLQTIQPAREEALAN